MQHPGVTEDVDQIAERSRGAADRQTADAWVDRLLAFFETFGTFPTRCPVVAPPPPRAVRRTNFERKRYVYYEAFEADRVVRVLYVWHGGRDAGPAPRQTDPLRVSP